MLDRQASPSMEEIVKNTIEKDGDMISDLHIRSIGEGLYALDISLVTQYSRPPKYYKEMLFRNKHFVYSTIEVNQVCGPI